MIEQRAAGISGINGGGGLNHVGVEPIVIVTQARQSPPEIRISRRPRCWPAHRRRGHSGLPTAIGPLSAAHVGPRRHHEPPAVKPPRRDTLRTARSLRTIRRQYDSAGRRVAVVADVTSMSKAQLHDMFVGEDQPVRVAARCPLPFTTNVVLETEPRSVSDRIGRQRRYTRMSDHAGGDTRRSSTRSNARLQRRPDRRPRVRNGGALQRRPSALAAQAPDSLRRSSAIVRRLIGHCGVDTAAVSHGPTGAITRRV